jgi:hypothetical protein
VPAHPDLFAAERRILVWVVSTAHHVQMAGSARHLACGDGSLAGRPELDAHAARWIRLLNEEMGYGFSIVY